MSEPTASAAPFGKLERTLAWRYLRARREHGGASLISIISFVGIFFAVAALIVTMSVMSGFRATLLDAFLGGQPHVYLNVQNLSSDESDTIALELLNIEGVEAVYPTIHEQVLASNGQRKAGAIVRAIKTEDLKYMPFLEAEGTDPLAVGFGEGRNGGDVVLVGVFLALGREGLAVWPGDKFEITTARTVATVAGSAPRKKAYTTGAIFETGSVELDRLYVLMPMEQAQILFGMKGRYGRLELKLTDPYMARNIRDEIDKRTNFGIETGDWMDDRKEYLNALNIERTMVRLLVMIIMAIATLNIIVGVVMLVKNKARDIAILRTIGLSRSAVTRVFMMVGTVLGTLGALLGVAVGVAIVLNIGAVEAFINLFIPGELFDAETYGLSQLPAILDWGEVFSTAIYAVFLSIIVSIIPSMWAARQDPVAALRFE